MTAKTANNEAKNFNGASKNEIKQGFMHSSTYGEMMKEKDLWNAS
jgi:hypothetical protein